MEKNPREDIQLPPGFRFHPSDEELIVHYLRKKATKSPLPASIVAEVELYKFNPWDLPKKSLFGDEEWYFFTPRDRKYPNGMRPNRMAASGYWKATGIDKPILTFCGSKVIGVKKALVFYTGRPRKSNRTDWIMHEYRLPEPDVPWSAKNEKSMRLDEWVLCRVRLKTGMPYGNFWDDRNNSGPNPSNKPAQPQHQPKLDKQCSPSAETTPNFEMVRGYIYKDCSMLPFLFGSTSSSMSFEGNKTSSSVCEDNFNIDYLQNSIPTASNGVSITRKRKLFSEENCQEIFRQPNTKATSRYFQQNEQVRPPESTSTITNVDNGMISCTNRKEKSNYSVDQLSQSMMYQELYSLAFA